MPHSDDAHRERFREIYEHLDESAQAAPVWSTIPKPESGVSQPPWRGPMVAIAVAAGVLAIIGLASVMLGRSGSDSPPAGSDGTGIDATPTTAVSFVGFKCPVTIPPLPGFTPPEGYPALPSTGVWYGSEGLWTLLELDGSYLPRKTVFWSANNPGGGLENFPEVDVTWTRLDTDAEPISNNGKATNGTTSEDGWFMIAGLDPEEPGCWEVSATYKGATLTYVYEVPVGGYIADAPLFNTHLPWMLVFDDGLDGITTVEPNSRTATRMSLDGQDAGDQPYRLGLTDDRLIVGWGGVSSVAIDDASSVYLGDATIWIPAAEPGHVWLIDYPGDIIGSGLPTVSYKSVTSRLVYGPTRVDTEGFPAIGIQGGLAIETDEGVALWYTTGDHDTSTLGINRAYVSDVSRNRSNLLAWCQARCTQMHVTDLDDGTDTVFEHPVQGTRYDARSARFAAEGRFLAATASDDIVIMNLTTGESYVAASMTPSDVGRPFLAWAPFGPELFASSFSYGGSETEVVHIHLGTGVVDSVTLPFGGAMSLVVVDRNHADALTGRPGGNTPADCPPPNPRTGGRLAHCSFSF